MTPFCDPDRSAVTISLADIDAAGTNFNADPLRQRARRSD
jgi:hypothetical protein